MTPYAELDVTSNFSFLRGGSHGEELVAQAKALAEKNPHPFWASPTVIGDLEALA